MDFRGYLQKSGKFFNLRIIDAIRSANRTLNPEFKPIMMETTGI